MLYCNDQNSTVMHVVGVEVVVEPPDSSSKRLLMRGDDMILFDFNFSPMSPTMYFILDEMFVSRALGHLQE